MRVKNQLGFSPLALANLILITFFISCAGKINESSLVTSNGRKEKEVEVSEVIIPIVPDNIIVAFKQSTCPSGWFLVPALRGRMPVGAGSGNLDANGDSLSFRTFGELGGMEITSGIRVNANEVDQQDVVASFLGSGEDSFSSLEPNDCISGTDCSRGNVPPFVSYTYCKPAFNNSVVSIPEKAVIHQEGSNCIGDTSVDTDSSGRFIIGAGWGNRDKLNNQLTNYSFGDTGGLEITNSIPTRSIDIGNADDPSNMILGESAFGRMFASGNPDSAYGDGNLADSNMSPYLVLNSCEYTHASNDKLPIGSIMAFDQSSCPSGWSDYSNLAGRSVLSSGAGNLDRDGNALTTRSSLETGGLEYTSTLPVISTAANSFSPSGANSFLAYNPDGNSYIDSPSISETLGDGGIADSNMSPFAVVKFCIKN